MQITVDWLQRRLDTAKILGNVPTNVNVVEHKPRGRKRTRLVILAIIVIYILISWRYGHLAGG